MAKIDFRPLAFNVNAPPEIVTREGRKAAREIAQGKSLERQLQIGRLMLRGHDIACRKAGLPNAAHGRLGRAYNEALSEWLKGEPDLARVSPDIRNPPVFRDWLKANWHYPPTSTDLAPVDDTTDKPEG
jgi:hypothetical protein